MREFPLTEEFIELNKLLKVQNLVPSGGMAKMVIEDKLVRVNGEVELRKRRKLRSGDVVDFQGVSIKMV
ncbi:MAG: RNA-binding S4 domain-containing protein [Flavobacteriales bacterium]|nr:RNA-binding S4 domain-containing protein [Flavobacteriales bacterium]MDG1780436.1 RNA-binding S4 domain-containing protein [Flavobacteriales bacterium]MDG2245098.1 RNA-binding S4 domain-containing protein [Flavobacteriales bacterium]